MHLKPTAKTGRTIATIIVATMAMACSSANGNNEPISASHQLTIIPEPTKIEYSSAMTAIPSSAGISTDIPENAFALLQNELPTAKREKNDKAFIRIATDKTLGEEAYKLSVKKGCVTITSSSDKGTLWAVQTLRQMLDEMKYANVNWNNSIPQVEISDAPQFGWRGFHIDVSRHMFTIDCLKKVVDCLSFYKINHLQIHLTDDQGWRIEVKSHPELTAKGAWRDFDNNDSACLAQGMTIDPKFIKNGQYGGYYTQDEIRGLISYATERGVEIVPEIDMPGHFSAAIKSNPQLSCTGNTGWGKEFSYPMCPSKETSYTFVEDILNEMTALFPSKYFHIGADEVEKDNWRKCPDCQAMIKAKGYTGVSDLQDMFVTRVTKYLQAKGKNVITWDDAFSSAAPAGLTYMFWRGWLPERAGEIAKAGSPEVFTDCNTFYLSSETSDKHLKNLLLFDRSEKYSSLTNNDIMGYQSCVWTEEIPNEKVLCRHIFPAMQAYSEVAWGCQQRNWDNFCKSINQWHLLWLTAHGLTYRAIGEK
jgi:hexosaminidase